MNILIFHPGTLSECFVASSINKGLKKVYPDCNIFWVVDEEYKYIFEYSDNVSNVLSINEFSEDTDRHIYDICINFAPIPAASMPIVATDRRGFGFDSQSEKYYHCLYKESPLKMNLFQIYFRIAHMSWRGEGYDINYYPKCRSKKNRVGLSIANANLRNFVNEQLNLEMSKLWVVPYKKNVFRRMDEINKCKTIITDDLLTLHAAVALKKSVFFLKTMPISFQMEFFGNGKVYDVPSSYLR